MPVDTIVSRLKQYLELKKIKPSKAETEIGVSNGTLSKPFNTRTTIKTDTLEKFLIRYIDINPIWLLTGKGSPLRSEGPEDAKQPLIGPVESRLLELLDQKDGRITDLEEQVKRLKKEEEPGLDYYHVAEPEIKLKAPKGKKKD